MGIPVLFLESSSGHENDVTDKEATSTALHLVQTLVSIRRRNRNIRINCLSHLACLEIAPSRTLQTTLAGPAYADQWLLIKTIASNSPLSHGLDGWVEDAGALEAKTTTGNESLALTWANLCNTATVSMHVPPIWSEDWVSAECTSLDANAEVQTTTKDIRNLSHPGHAKTHHDWLGEINSSNTATVVWSERNDRFPNLRLLAGVERQLAELFASGAPYIQALETLKNLEEDARRWGGTGEPNFSIKVAAGEHDRRRDLAFFRDEVTGETRDFGRHAYFTGGIAGRIHFLVDATEKRFIIGYLGKKL